MAKVSHSNPFLDDVLQPERKIIANHVFPPIPDRSNDWCAYYDDVGPEDGPCGWGPTREAAISDLKENYNEEAA
jgi:hypothetical protein